jgi:hypothetical protein
VFPTHTTALFTSIFGVIIIFNFIEFEIKQAASGYCKTRIALSLCFSFSMVSEDFSNTFVITN